MDNAQTGSARGRPIVVDRFGDLLEAVSSHPEHLLVLRGDGSLNPALLEQYAARLGGVLVARGFGTVRTVKYDATATTSTAQSLQPLAFHTDGSFLDTPPSRFLLGCVRPDARGGGVSTFIYIDDLIAALPEWVTTALIHADCRFLQTYDGDLSGSVIARVLWGRAGDRIRIRWRSDDIYRPSVIRPNGTQAEAAVLWVHEFLRNAEPIRYALTAGETLLVPNTVMLHGRTALSSDSDREMLRVWII